MNSTADISLLVKKIESFSANDHARSRSLAVAAAALTTAEQGLIDLSLKVAEENDNSISQIYELILQSYLFLGFPRMLGALFVFAGRYPDFKSDANTGPVSTAEALQWYDQGMRLCRLIYDENFERLQDKVLSISPEIFRWMIVEGYGKVLSRPQLDIVDRELCIVAFLMMENMPKQLHSHILGAINVGADKALLKSVIADIGAAAGGGYDSAKQIVKGLD